MLDNTFSVVFVSGVWSTFDDLAMDLSNFLQNEATDEKSPASPQDHRVGMDFTGRCGKVIDNEEEVEALKKDKHNVVRARGPSIN